MDTNAAVYFVSFGIEYISQETLNKIEGKSITPNIFRIHSDGSAMRRFYYIPFIEYMLTGKTFLDYSYLLFLNDYSKH